MSKKRSTPEFVKVPGADKYVMETVDENGHPVTTEITGLDSIAEGLFGKPRSHPVPPSGVRAYQSLDELDRPIFGLQEHRVAAWRPERGGSGSTTQVHLLAKSETINLIFALRLATREECDRLIADLQEKRDEVWPAPITETQGGTAPCEST